MSITTSANTRKIEKKDERINPKIDMSVKGLTNDPTVVVAAEFDPNDEHRSWDEIRDHLKSTLQKNETIATVIVRIAKEGEQASRWIDYSAPREGHNITVNPGAKLEKTDNLHWETLTIIDTGGPNTNYRHYPGCYTVCQ